MSIFANHSKTSRNYTELVLVNQQIGNISCSIKFWFTSYRHKIPGLGGWKDH